MMAMPAGPAPHYTLTRTWLEELYRDAPGWLTLFALDRTSGQQHIIWQPTTHLDQLADDAAILTGQCCVWFGVATRKHRTHGRGTAADCTTLPGLWVDIDIAGPNHKTGQPLPTSINQAEQILNGYPLAPTAIVNTGGGIQAWWLFNEPHPIDNRTADMLARWGHTWAEHARGLGWHVDNVFDLARIMRLPGTVNRKTVPTPVTIHGTWGPRYHVDDLDQYTLDLPDRPDPTVVQRVPYIGPERPGDAFNATRTGGELLHQLGFQLARRDRNGDEHWTGPWKEPRQGASATVYAADGHTTIWSDTAVERWPRIELRRPYDPFGLYTVIHHDGNWRAARETLAQAGYGQSNRADDDLSWVNFNGPSEAPRGAATGNGITTPSMTPLEPPAAVQRHSASLIDWATFWNRDTAQDDWLAEPFLARGRGHALYAPAKTGKSLFGLYVAAGLAAGHAILNQPPGTPRTVVYFDLEMTEDDIEERLEEMGYGPHSSLERLYYHVLPSLSPLDGPVGGSEVVEIARWRNADLVVIDTTARAVVGKENDADTMRAFYTHTGRPLKAEGRTVLRIDHAGKDLERGQRGTSAKADDVDIVWRMTSREANRFRLDATHRRVNWVPATVDLEQQENPLRYVSTRGSLPAGTLELAEQLNQLGVPLDATVAMAQTALRQAGRGRSTRLVAAAVRWRKTATEREEKWPDLLADSEKTFPEDSRNVPTPFSGNESQK